MLEEYNDRVNGKCGYTLTEWHFTCPNCHTEVWMQYYPEIRDLLTCECNSYFIVTGMELSISPDGKKSTKFTIRPIPLWKVEEARKKGDIVPKPKPKPRIPKTKSPVCRKIPDYIKKSLIDAIVREQSLKETLKSLKDKNPENV